MLHRSYVSQRPSTSSLKQFDPRPAKRLHYDCDQTTQQNPQDRWRAVNAPHLVALVRAGAPFEAGKLVERPDEDHQPTAA